jgi:hypothetical protein
VRVATHPFQDLVVQAEREVALASQTVMVK